MTQNYYNIILAAVFMGAISFSPQGLSNPATPAQKKFIQAEIGSKKYTLEVADTIGKREQGLSNRKNMDKNQGMIFIFEQPDNYKFCMYNMLFPLDFIWIRHDKVVNLTPDVPPPPTPNDYKDVTAFTVAEKFDKVIELNAGQIKSSKIKIGDAMKFSWPPK